MIGNPDVSRKYCLATETFIRCDRHTRAAGSQYNFVQRLVGRLRRRGFLIDDLVSGETK